MTKKTAYTLIRSKRKTIALYVTQEAAVMVRAPMKVPDAEIERFVASKQNWIDRHMALRETLRKEKEAFALDYGSLLLMGDREYTITADAAVGVDAGTRGFAIGGRFCLPPGMTPALIKRAVIKAYRHTARELLTERTAVWAERMRLSPSAVKINAARTRWGSCSGRNSLNFSWRLIMAADDVIDYVVVHELAHIKEHNHSERFWAVVRKVLPDYEERKARLKKLQTKLAAEDWESDK